MMPVKHTPWLVPPRASAIPQADNLHPALTTQQISQIARIFDPTVEDELKEAKNARTKYQSSRKRDAGYDYLRAVFEIVCRWRKERRVKASSHQALNANTQRGAIRLNRSTSWPHES